MAKDRAGVPRSRQRKVRRQLAGIALSAAAQAAFAQPPLEFKGLPLGSSVDQAKQHFAALECRPSTGAAELGDTVCFSLARIGCPVGGCEKPTLATYAGVDLELAVLHFGGDRLLSVSMRYKPEVADQIIEAITLKHGKPTADTRTTVQNRMGAAFEQREATWDTPGGRLKVSRYAGRVTSGLASITGIDAVQYMQSRRPSKEQRLNDM
jgi:hypothetical protein